MDKIIESYDEFLNEGRKKQTVVLSDDKKSIILTNALGQKSRLTSLGNNYYLIVGITRPKGSDWNLDRNQTLIRMYNYDSPSNVNKELLKQLKVVREGIESFDDFLNEGKTGDDKTVITKELKVDGEVMWIIRGQVLNAKKGYSVYINMIKKSAYKSGTMDLNPDTNTREDIISLWSNTKGQELEDALSQLKSKMKSIKIS